MKAIDRAIGAALALSDLGIEPTRPRVLELLRGVRVDGPTLDAAIVGVLSLHGWLVDPGNGLDGSKKRAKSRAGKPDQHGKRRAA